jgi:hypothetical protein
MPEQAKSALVLHCGAREASREELARVPTPEATKTWFPVPHLKVVERVEASLADAGFQVRSMKFGLSRSDSRMFAVADLATPLVAGVTLAVGIRSSLDKSLPLGWVGGNRTFCCDNLAFRSDLTVSRKHTRNGEARFGEAIRAAVKNLAAFEVHEAERIRALQRADMDDRQAESLILRAYERQLVSHRLLAGVIREWRDPSFPDFHESRDAWRLLNAFTTVLAGRQRSNPQSHASLTMRLGGFLDEHLGITPFAVAGTQEATSDDAQAV